MIPGFDKAVQGKKIDETFTVTLAPADAYGERDEKNMVEFPLADIEKALSGSVKV